MRRAYPPLNYTILCFVLSSGLNFFSFIADDWGSVFGSPTKLGLGIVTVAFDVFFFVQHHIYKRPGLQIQGESEGEGGNESEAAPFLSEEVE